MVINKNYINNINKINRPVNTPLPQAQQKAVDTKNSFGKILQQKVDKAQDLKFSKHAELRMRSRNIQLTEEQKQKMNEAVKKAGEKGVKDSLVMVDDAAFVVNVKNRTVITAVNSNELKENVFTNIDGAVFT